jgi:hypothetical protein
MVATSVRTAGFVLLRVLALVYAYHHVTNYLCKFVTWLFIRFCPLDCWALERVMICAFKTLAKSITTQHMVVYLRQLQAAPFELEHGKHVPNACWKVSMEFSTLGTTQEEMM